VRGRGGSFRAISFCMGESSPFNTIIVYIILAISGSCSVSFGVGINGSCMSISTFRVSGSSIFSGFSIIPFYVRSISSCDCYRAFCMRFITICFRFFSFGVRNQTSCYGLSALGVACGSYCFG
jgi:hypothetical protein